MELGLKVLVLLAFAFNLTLCDFDCPANTYKNDERLITSLSGWLYTQYTSFQFGDNEIFNCDVSFNNKFVYCLTTNDNQCCRSFNISTEVVANKRYDRTSDYFSYLIKTEPDCPTQIEEYAYMKLLAGNTDRDGSYCFMLWTCRPSREGIHAFCDSRTISVNQMFWIIRQYSKYGRAKSRVKQDSRVDYRHGKCFPKITETGFDDFSN